MTGVFAEHSPINLTSLSFGTCEKKRCGSQWQHMIGSIGCNMNRLVVKQLPGWVCHSVWWEFKSQSMFYSSCTGPWIRQGRYFTKGPTPRTIAPLCPSANNITDISSLAHKQVCESNKDHVTNSKRNYLQMQDTNEHHISYTGKLKAKTRGTLALVNRQAKPSRSLHFIPEIVDLHPGKDPPHVRLHVGTVYNSVVKVKSFRS